MPQLWAMQVFRDKTAAAAPVKDRRAREFPKLFSRPKRQACGLSAQQSQIFRADLVVRPAPWQSAPPSRRAGPTKVLLSNQEEAQTAHGAEEAEDNVLPKETRTKKSRAARKKAAAEKKTAAKAEEAAQRKAHAEQKMVEGSYDEEDSGTVNTPDEIMHLGDEAQAPPLSKAAQRKQKAKSKQKPESKSGRKKGSTPKAPEGEIATPSSLESPQEQHSSSCESDSGPHEVSDPSSSNGVNPAAETADSDLLHASGQDATASKAQPTKRKRTATAKAAYRKRKSKAAEAKASATADLTAQGDSQTALEGVAAGSDAAEAAADVEERDQGQETATPSSGDAKIEPQEVVQVLLEDLQGAAPTEPVADPEPTKPGKSVKKAAAKTSKKGATQKRRCCHHPHPLDHDLSPHVCHARFRPSLWLSPE